MYFIGGFTQFEYYVASQLGLIFVLVSFEDLLVSSLVLNAASFVESLFTGIQVFSRCVCIKLSCYISVICIMIIFTFTQFF
jgi:hypothetical protein